MRIKQLYITGSIYFEPRDCWVGVYWKRFPKAVDVYICILPMLPWNLYFSWQYQ